MKSIKIEIPQGFKIDSFDKSTGLIKFKPDGNIKDRFKTFEDILKDHGINKGAFNDACEDLSPDEIGYRKVKLIVESFNEGWEPDWSNENECKYYPWFKMGSSSGSGFACDGCGDWRADSAVGSRLCFKSRELAEYAGKQFEDIYKEFFTS